MSNYLTQQQISFLLNPIEPTRVQHLRGMSHLEAHDIRVHLTRVFGFARWSAETISMDLVYEMPRKLGNGKDGLDVAYKAGVRLTVKAPDGTELATFTEYAVGAQSQPATNRGDLHDYVVKTAESQALKRCAMNLGDAFGLSLYNKGYMGPIVQGTLMWAPEKPVDETLDVQTVPVEPEEQPPGEEQEQPPAAQQQQQPQQAPEQPQAPAPAPEPQAPQQPAQPVDEGMTLAQAEVKDLVAKLSPADKATFRAAWKKAQLPPGYHRLGDNHIQWIHAQLDDLAQSTGLPTTGDNPATPPQDPDRQALVEQARAHFPNAPEGELEHQFYS